MKKESFNRYIMLITYTILLSFIMLNIHGIWSMFGKVINAFTPLWIGITLALILNVPMSIIEKECFNEKSKLSRAISLILSIMIILILLLILFVWVIPDFIDSASYLVAQIPSLINGLNDLLINTFKNTDLSEYLRDFSGSGEITAFVSDGFRYIINNFSSALSNFAAFIINLVTGIIIAIYFLLEKEKIIHILKDLIERIFSTKIVKKIYSIFELANKSFHNFITYQCLECLVFGSIMFIVLLIFGFPYALTIAFLTTVMSIIPLFGSLVACLIGTVCIGTISIKQAILFAIVYEVVVQFDSNVIYPRIVGKHVGLPPVVTIIAIIVGGKLAGFVGMVTCIPLTAILYSLFRTKLSDKKPKKKVKEIKDI